MNAIKDGGPAFPRAGFWSDGGPCATDTQPQGGMSLRDWFAGQVMLGLISHGPAVDIDDATLARGAYTVADAMLKARDL
jgi:hypothetical protein